MSSRTGIAIALAAVWIVAGGAIYLARRATPTAESVAAYVRDHPLENLDPARRREVIDRTAEMMNGLAFEERQQLRRADPSRGLFESMTDEERARFLEATLPAGFKQMMEAFNRMEPARRKRFVSRALDRMKEDAGERAPPNLEDPNVRRIIDQGLKSFYNDASADTKLDLAPLIEQMQKGMQGLGR